MVAMIGTELSMPMLVEDFLRIEIEGRSACQLAMMLVAGPDERFLLAELMDVHERHLALLRRLARDCGTWSPVEGTDHEASHDGRIRLAHMNGGDRGILAGVAEIEHQAIAAYRRALRSTTLPLALRPAFEQAAGELGRQCARLDHAARLAA